MTQDMSGAAAEVWRAQRQWSHAAGRLKKSTVAWRNVALAAAIVGAVLATLAAQVGLESPAGRALGLAAAVALALTPVVRARRLGRERVEAWTRVRSASERLKTEIYLYLTGTPPYDGDDRDQQLHRRADAILSDVDDLAGHTIGMPTADKPLPDVADVESYLTVRVQGQIDAAYTPDAGRQQRLLSRFRGVELGLSLLGALVGAIAAVTRQGSVGVWVAVITTVGAAITAHIAAARYEYLVVSYLSTARQLRFLAAQWRTRPDKTPAAAARLVRDCEDVISRENMSWMAAWSRGEDSAAPSVAAP